MVERKVYMVLSYFQGQQSVKTAVNCNIMKN